MCEALKNKNVKVGRLLEDTRKEVTCTKREIEGTVKKLKTKQTFMEKLISSRQSVYGDKLAKQKSQL